MAALHDGFFDHRIGFRGWFPARRLLSAEIGKSIQAMATCDAQIEFRIDLHVFRIAAAERSASRSVVMDEMTDTRMTHWPRQSAPSTKQTPSF
jgi:hypothetical protein